MFHLITSPRYLQNRTHDVYLKKRMCRAESVDQILIKLHKARTCHEQTAMVQTMVMMDAAMSKAFNASVSAFSGVGAGVVDSSVLLFGYLLFLTLSPHGLSRRCCGDSSAVAISDKPGI